MLITGPSSTSPFLLAFSSPARNSRLPFPRGVENPDLAIDANHQDANSISEAGEIEGRLKGHWAYHVWEGNEPCSNVYRTAIFRMNHMQTLEESFLRIRCSCRRRIRTMPLIVAS